MDHDPLHIVFYRCSESTRLITKLHHTWSHQVVDSLREISSDNSPNSLPTCVLSSFYDDPFWELFCEHNPKIPFFQVLEDEEQLPLKAANEIIFPPHSTEEFTTRIRFGLQQFTKYRELITHKAKISKNQKIQLDLNDRLLKRSVELKRAKERVELLSLMDPLTKVNNRRFFDFQLPREIHQSQRYNTKLSLLIMDVDHFKSINDNYGHPFGDDILVQLGELIRLLLRDTDWAARYGGEEFSIVLPMTGLHGALKTAERLRKSVEEKLPKLEGKSITVSIGVARFHRKLNQEQLIKYADEALYKAKSCGRNCVYYFNHQQEDFCEFTSGATQ